jgi:mRNA interferase MazF
MRKGTESRVSAMKEGDIVLVALPQADGRIKYRPALILRKMPPFGDFLVCGISTQIHQAVPGFDEIVEDKSDDFPASGLRAPSLIRLGFLAMLESVNSPGIVGSISIDRYKCVIEKLCTYLSRREIV